MDRTNGSLLCTFVSFVAGLVVIGLLVAFLGSAIMASPGVSHLMHVLGY